MDGWKMSFLLGFPIFRVYVKLRGCILMVSERYVFWLTFPPGHTDPLDLINQDSKMFLIKPGIDI